MNKLNLSPLKLLSFALAGAGMLIASELSRRDLDEAVNKALDERGITPPADSQ